VASRPRSDPSARAHLTDALRVCSLLLPPFHVLLKQKDWLLSLFDVPLLYLFIEYFMMNLVNPITWGSFFDVLLSLIGPLTLIAEGCCVLRMIYTIPRRAIEQSENEESTKVLGAIFPMCFTLARRFLH
jgi:hypothetical protein